jgi:succinate-acetate transporter protein
MSTDQSITPAVPTPPRPRVAPEASSVRPAPVPAAAATGVAWGNSAPLALAGFATTTFMLSLIYIDVVPAAATPVVFGVALMFGGLAQFVGGVIQLRMGNTFGGMLFCGFGAFWLSLFAIAEFFIKSVPVAQVGHAEGLFLYAFGIFAAIMLAASFRTSIVVVTALAGLTAALFVLGAALYTASLPVIAGVASSGLLKTGGWIALVIAGLAFYLALAEVCEFTYGREILPVGHLAKSEH